MQWHCLDLFWKGAIFYIFFAFKSSSRLSFRCCIMTTMETERKERKKEKRKKTERNKQTNKKERKKEKINNTSWKRFDERSSSFTFFFPLNIVFYLVCLIFHFSSFYFDFCCCCCWKNWWKNNKIILTQINLRSSLISEEVNFSEKIIRLKIIYIYRFNLII